MPVDVNYEQVLSEMKFVFTGLLLILALVSCKSDESQVISSVSNTSIRLDASSHSPGDPEAHAFCMPNRGWAPLHVHFSPFMSDASHGPIERYQWDLDGDGVFETDATRTDGYTDYSYTKPGEYVAYLQITDSNGLSAVDAVEISVRDPEKSTVDYWKIFDDSKVQRVDLTVNADDWDRLWEDINKRLEIEADAVIFGKWISNVGLSMKGNGSLFDSGDKKSWKIDTNEYAGGQEYQNLKMLLFHNNYMDPSLLREKMAYDMLRFAGLPAGHVSYVEIWIDIRDDKKPSMFWGVYSMVERVDRKFLANRFGQGNKYGNLYKGYGWFDEGAADLAYYGEDIDDYPHPGNDVCYQKETNKGDPDYSDVIELCRIIDGEEYDSDEEFITSLEAVFNVDAYLRYIACMVLCDNWDIYPFCANNYYIYNDPGSGRFEWIPWDLNSAWDGEVHRELFQKEWGGPVDYAPLHEKVFGIPQYRQDYLAYVDLLMRYWFHPDIVRKRAQELHNLVEPYVKQSTGDKMFFGDTAKFSIEDFAVNWESTAFSEEPVKPGIVNFTEERWHFLNEALRLQLEGSDYDPDQSDLWNDQERMHNSKAREPWELSEFEEIYDSHNPQWDE